MSRLTTIGVLAATNQDAVEGFIGVRVDFLMRDKGGAKMKSPASIRQHSSSLCSVQEGSDRQSSRHQATMPDVHHCLARDDQLAAIDGVLG